MKKEPLGNGVSVFVTEDHHFSTDTILLSSFAAVKETERAVELGSGCGAIVLLWLRNAPPKEIVAVELMTDAADLLKLSLEENRNSGVKHTDNVRVLNMDWNDLHPTLSQGEYDLVVCNPPYKKHGAGILNPSEKKRIARHETPSTLSDVCAAAKKLLRYGGRFCLCQRPERLADVMGTLREHDLEPKRLRVVQQRQKKPAKLFLIEARRGGKPGFLTVEPTLLLEDESGAVSEEMKAIYGSYKEGH